jgi:hypothetical protein
VSEYQLGSEVQYKDKTWRVIRIVTTDQSLFEDSDTCYVILESFVMIKDADGFIDFIVLNSEKLPYSGPVSSIKGLSIIPWRQHA